LTGRFLGELEASLPDGLRAGRRQPARLLALHALEPDLVPEGPTYVAQPTVPFSETQGEQVRLEGVKRRLGEVHTPVQAIDVDNHARRGEDSQEVLRVVDEVWAGLIAMGTHAERTRTHLVSLWQKSFGLDHSVKQAASSFLLPSSFLLLWW
jgi:hypothetical protein